MSIDRGEQGLIFWYSVTVKAAQFLQHLSLDAWFLFKQFDKGWPSKMESKHTTKVKPINGVDLVLLGQPSYTRF